MCIINIKAASAAGALSSGQISKPNSIVKTGVLRLGLIFSQKKSNVTTLQRLFLWFTLIYRHNRHTCHWLRDRTVTCAELIYVVTHRTMTSLTWLFGMNSCKQTFFRWLYLNHISAFAEFFRNITVCTSNMSWLMHGFILGFLPHHMNTQSQRKKRIIEHDVCFFFCLIYIMLVLKWDWRALRSTQRVKT